MNNFFELEHTDKQSKARAGKINTAHGTINTPAFMPVGTQGSVKAIEHRELKEIGAKIILGNTYHLYLRPGIDVISQFKGLHKFINWDGAILTDSGGYQIFSLQELRKITEEGAEFKSHIDGSKHFFSPEKVVEIQKILGSDIMMVLDECTPYPVDQATAKKSMDLSYLWAERSCKAFKDIEQKYSHRQYIFPIGQGSVFENLRKEYLNKIIELDADGISIGGLSVGEPAEDMYRITDISTDIIPENKPRYLMGVGTPENILECIELGIDMFDCVLPTRNARNGQIFTSNGKVNIKNAKFKTLDLPIDNKINSYASQNFSLSYLRHLFISGEILGLQLATIHNLAFYQWLVKTAREKILSDEYRQWKDSIIERLSTNFE